MPTIRGPITIKKGREGLQTLAEQGVDVGLPFEASGWKSQYNEDLVKSSDATPETPVAKVEADQDLEILTVKELRELCKDMGLKVAGTKKELIERLSE